MASIVMQHHNVQYAYIASGMSADDSSRVVLSVPNTSGTDYINASFVNVSNAYVHTLYIDLHSDCHTYMCNRQ